MRNLLFILFTCLLVIPNAYAQQNPWASTDADGQTTEMRIPVDIGPSDIPSYFSLVPSIATGVFFNNSGNFVNDTGFVYDSTGNDLSVAGNMEATDYCDEAGANCVDPTVMLVDGDIGGTVQAFDVVLDDLAALSAVADNEIIVGTGAGTYAHESGATARTSLGLAIGVDVQAFDANNALTDVAQEYTAQQNFNATTLTALGADLVTNGDFASDTNWTKGTGWTIGSGVANSDATQSADSDLTENTLVLVSGNTYEVTFTVTNYVAGNVTPVAGGTEGTDRAANGTFTENILSAGADLDIRADLDFDGDIDDVIVKLANVSWNLDTNQVTTLTLDGDLVLDNPTNQVDGSTYIIRPRQDGTGTRLLTYGSVFKFPGGTAPTLTTAASAKDILTCVSDGTNMECVFQGDFK